jgi:hypothetical protein
MKEKDNDLKNNDNEEEDEKEEKENDEEQPKEIIITRKRRENKESDETNPEKEIEIIGPRIKRCKREQKEDKELQIACEDAEERKERIKEEKIEAKIKKQKQKDEDLKNKNLIYSIDEENYRCVDCDKEKTTYISINNGVTLCDFCAKQHLLLGNSISFIKSINAQLDEYLFNYIVFGSNTKFKRFISNENLDHNLIIKKKYKTKCLDYYRKLLKSKVEGTPKPVKNYQNPNEIVEDNNLCFPEFDKYKIKKQIIVNGLLKGESKLGNLFNKLLNIKNDISKKMNPVTILRTRSSGDELNDDAGNTDEDDNPNNKKQRSKKKQSKDKQNNDNKIILTTLRYLNGEDENKKTEENIETNNGQQETNEKNI